jgi:DNA-binding MarR family transcriptional regulator
MAKVTRRDRPRQDVPPQDVGSVLDAVCFHIGRTFYQYVGLMEQQLEAQKLGDSMRPGMGHILFALFEEDDVIIKSLVERTQLSPSALTGLLQRMEQAGFIRRYRDKEDARAVRVALTPAGRGLEDRCLAALKQIRSIMERDIPEADITCTRRCLMKMYHNMRSAMTRRGMAS